jgi:poly-gamma-glutamate synthesis protein (capsule biosynthesis protein)
VAVGLAVARGGPASHGTVVVPPADVSGIDENSSTDSEGPRGTVTLAFAGDVHFQLHLAALLDHPSGALGPITQTLKATDVTMVNLESAITGRGTPEAKELEVASQRYYYRTSPAALGVLTAAGIDVVTMANNHDADYGPVGVADSLASIRTSPIPVVGIGRNRRTAFEGTRPLPGIEVPTGCRNARLVSCSPDR